MSRKNNETKLNDEAKLKVARSKGYVSWNEMIKAEKSAVNQDREENTPITDKE